jgi:hypothetical protein
MKEIELQAQLEDLDYRLLPENIQKALAFVGSVRPMDELREALRIRIENEKVSVAKQNDHNYQFTNTKTKRHHAHQKRVEHGLSKSGNCEPAFPRSTPHVRNGAVDNGASIAAVQRSWVTSHRDDDAVRSRYRRRKAASGILSSESLSSFRGSHHAPFLRTSSFSFSVCSGDWLRLCSRRLRARARRDITVPTGISVTSAICL